MFGKKGTRERFLHGKFRQMCAELFGSGDEECLSDESNNLIMKKLKSAFTDVSSLRKTTLLQLPVDPCNFKIDLFLEHGNKFLKTFGSETLQPQYKETPEYYLKYLTSVGDLIKTLNTRVPR